MKMNQDEFDSRLTLRITSILSSLSSKQKEYATGEDKLHNFNEGARITGKTRETVLNGFLLKHLISYNDILKDIELGKLPSEEVVKEKLGDIINYFILQEISILQKVNANKNKTKTTDVGGTSSGITGTSKDSGQFIEEERDADYERSNCSCRCND